MRRIIIAAALAMCVCLCGCGCVEVESSPEFERTEYGADRFVWYRTNLDTGVYVLVDRDTGVEYVAIQNGGTCPLYEADGSMMLVGEADRPEVER